MLDSIRISEFIAGKRKELGMTQAEVAQRLGVSYQAVSKWENGTLPNVEMLATFNCGVGMNIVVSKEHRDAVAALIGRYYDCYEIGSICRGGRRVIFEGAISW